MMVKVDSRVGENTCKSFLTGKFIHLPKLCGDISLSGQKL